MRRTTSIHCQIELGIKPPDPRRVSAVMPLLAEAPKLFAPLVESVAVFLFVDVFEVLVVALVVVSVAGGGVW